MKRDGIEERIDRFMKLVQIMLDTYMAANFPTLPRPEILWDGGTRYAKLILQELGGSTARPEMRRRVFAFIDMTNGDLLKAESWKKPAKYARGNIFDDDYGMTNVGPYGVSYMDHNRNILKPLAKDRVPHAEEEEAEAG